MKYYEAKKNKVFTRGGFYALLALFLVAIGVAVYTSSDTKNEIKQNNETNEEVREEVKIPEILTESEETKTAEETAETESEETAYTKNEVKATYFSLPLAGEIVKDFSSDTLFYSETYKDIRAHNGIDIKPSGSLLVNASGDGVVTSIDENTKLGTVITVNHGNNVYFRYCGLKNVKVSEGETLSVGQPIGEIGQIPDEIADEAHLHLEVIKDDTVISPSEFIGIN